MRGLAEVAFFCINCRSATDPEFKACPYCGEPITDFLRKYIEEPIDGKYKILSRLGIGGMGEVYKVLHLHLNTPRVIKLMRPNISADEKTQWRFVREARLATKINHPNVASLFDFSELSDGSFYMVWEYIEGITFSDLIRARKTLAPSHAVRLSIQALAGLNAVHKAGVVHRDISPENLMVTRDEDGDELVKIIDLGIAKQWDDTTDEKTKTGMFVGKWRYCSPEHLGLLKSGEVIDGRADIYSYAIVLYQMLTGVPPFDAQTPHQFVVLHSTADPDPLESKNPELVNLGELEAVIFRGLEKDREKRFSTASQFRKALQSVLPDLPSADEELSQTLDTIRSLSIRDDQEPMTAETMAATEVPELFEESGEDSGDRTIESDVTDVTVTQETKGSSAPPTVAEQRGAGFESTTLERPADATRGDGEPSIPWKWIGLAAVILLIAGLGWYIASRSETEVIEPGRGPVAASASTLAIDSFPWATVESITDLDSGRDVLEAPVPTPMTLDIPAGRYEIAVRSGRSNDVARQTSIVESGGRAEVYFDLAPDEASLPEFRSASR